MYYVLELVLGNEAQIRAPPASGRVAAVPSSDSLKRKQQKEAGNEKKTATFRLSGGGGELLEKW